LTAQGTDFLLKEELDPRADLVSTRLEDILLVELTRIERATS